MKRKVTYDLFYCFKTLKGIITFCLLLSMLTKPVVSVIFDMAAIEYELHESCEEKESKENTTDSEDEDPKLYCSFPDFEFHSNYKSFFFALHKDLISSHINIPFPPPDWG